MNPAQKLNDGFSIPAQISCFMKRLYDRGLTTSLGGNISCKIGQDILITPSGIDKGCLTEDDIIALNARGECISGKHSPSIESMMHLSIYEKRNDVFSIIHSHTFFGTLFSIIPMEINVGLTAESAKNIGIVGIADYARMGTMELAEVVSETAINHNAILMKNHGVVTVGRNILEAFYRLEILENAAKLTYFSHNLFPNELLATELDRYIQLGKPKNQE